MNESQTKLIEVLAAKLGTTVDHLWTVLVKQAPITATVDVIAIAIWILLLKIAFSYLKKYVRLEDAPSILLWIIWALTAAACLITVGCNAADILAGFFNPEYWALEQIIK